MNTRTVIMPERVWGRLASIAAEQDTPVADLIADAVETLVAPRLARDRVPDDKRDTLALMCEAGMSTSEIAMYFRVRQGRVALWLAQCDLKTTRHQKSKVGKGK